jgi:hypothetical protein
MCDFISWIEKDNKVVFLTGDDLRSKRGKALIKYCESHEDLLGHGAIRWFYGEFKGGKEKECSDFSSPDNFPKEIVQAVLNGDFRGVGISLMLLNDRAAEEYSAAESKYYEEYKNIRDRAWKECLEIQTAIKAGLDTSSSNSSINAAYEKIWDEDEKYSEIRFTAYNKYARQRGKIFWDLFANPENRSKAWKIAQPNQTPTRGA